MADMPSAMGAATVVITRAGASSLAELAAAGVPSIVVPLPSSVDEHQLANAHAVVAEGGGIIAEEDNTSPEHLAHIVSDLIHNEKKTESMAVGMRKLDRPDAAKVIATRIMERM
jgi:UDP-N-acetylglucosamine--N-acetylmuramyl-(pentapeptide) pyrophosphoryl-undecaprenol N-acetylglucosamine transferase